MPMRGMAVKNSQLKIPAPRATMMETTKMTGVITIAVARNNKTKMIFSVTRGFIGPAFGAPASDEETCRRKD